MWSPDGTKLFVAGNEAAGAIIMDFGEDQPQRGHSGRSIKVDSFS